MITLLLIIGAIFVGIPLIKLFLKLILGILGISLGLVSLPLLLVGCLVILPIVIVFGILTQLLPIIIVGGLIYLGYRYMTDRNYY
ncbi:hypothetical protein [uncultured Anaerococcus sp.]|uniref:hypothetical protein n=1 Tax=uncultured Anaerococcus sp. TaxID=293428 RepID=UPI0028894DBB|nr:hypothetical protein [uncultured Anaerococcus sp.]